MKVIIQKRLLAELKNKIDMQNELDLDKAVYIISLLNSLPSFYRKEENISGVNLDSQKLKSIISNYNKYIFFLIKNGFMEKVRNHSSNYGKSIAYRIPEHFYLDETIEFKIWNRGLLKKFDQVGRENSKETMLEFCRSARPHLTKYFNNKLSIDTIEALEELKCYLGTEHHHKYLHGRQLVMEWDSKSWQYSINKETDNRFHSNLTRTNRSLRKYLAYDGESLTGLDIKTSQPYFLSCILKGICFKDFSYLESLGVTDIISKEILLELSEIVDIDEARKFASIVINKDLYDELSKIIPVEYDSVTGNYYRWVFSKEKSEEFRIKKEYKSKRDCMKEVVLTIFNCKKGYNSPEIRAFSSVFPTVHKVINHIKKYVEFYRLLSHVEAFCILDKVAKRIEEEYPSVPLFSIHDCLVTTDKNAEFIKSKMQKYFKEITGIKINITIERWNNKLSKEPPPLLLVA